MDESGRRPVEPNALHRNVPPRSAPRNREAAVVIDGKIHVLGGEGWIEDFGGVFRAHEVYNPKTNSCAREPRMLAPRHGFAATEILRGVRRQQCQRRRHSVRHRGQRDLNRHRRHFGFAQKARMVARGEAGFRRKQYRRRVSRKGYGAGDASGLPFSTI
jgi:hypothetical protein